MELVENALQYMQACSKKAKELQSLKESSTTDGPKGTVSNKCLKSLERQSEEVSKPHQSQHSGLVPNSRAQNTLKYGVSQTFILKISVP